VLAINSDGAHTWLVDLGCGRRWLVARGQPAYSAACSTSLQTIALGGTARIRLLGWPGGRTLRELGGHNDGVRDMAFSPDGRTLVSAGGESEDEQHRDSVRLWDVRTGRELRSWLWHHIGAVAFHPGGRVVAVGCMMPGAIKLWHLDTDAVETVESADLGALSAACFSPDGSRLCVANRSGKLMMIEVQSDA
jgi:WD40 repeat protein